MDLERLKREEEEAEKAMFGSGEEDLSDKETPSPDDEGSDDVEDNENDESNSFTHESTKVTTQSEDTDDDEDDSDEDDESTQSKPTKKPRVSWKKRFASYKATTDSTIYSLRQELASTKSELADAYDSVDEMKKELASIKRQLTSSKDPYEGLVSDEDKELLGEEAINVIKKLASKKEEDPRIAQLQEELEELRKEKKKALKREQENFQVESQNKLKTGLLKLVPNFERIDMDPDFHKYLQGVDEDSGIPRSKLFASAVTSRDVKGTARFYLDFNSLKPKTREEILSSKVKPTGSGASSTDDSGNKGKKKMYHYQEYSKFMDDIGRGKYRGKEDEKKKWLAIYDRALEEGRMIF